MEVLFEGSWEEIRKEMASVLGVAASPTLGTGNVKTAAKSSASVTPTAVVPAGAPATPSTTVAPSTAATTEARTFDYKKIQEALPKAVELAGREKVVALLGKYGAKKGSELKPESYEAFYAECQALVGSTDLA